MARLSKWYCLHSRIVAEISSSTSFLHSVLSFEVLVTAPMVPTVSIIQNTIVIVSPSLNEKCGGQKTSALRRSYDMLLKQVAITKTHNPLSANCATASQNVPSQLFRKEIAVFISFVSSYIKVLMRGQNTDS